jgi:cytochrome c oxidase cbb3-type subunit 4
VDIGIVRGLITLVLMVAFVGMVIWVYSGRRKRHFEEAARLPFADEPADRQKEQSEENP